MSLDMRHPMFHKVDNEPEAMGVFEFILVFALLGLAFIAALVGLL